MERRRALCHCLLPTFVIACSLLDLSISRDEDIGFRESALGRFLVEFSGWQMSRYDFVSSVGGDADGGKESTSGGA